MSSDFLTAGQAILAEYGEPTTIKNRSGTTTGTAVQTFMEDRPFQPNYWGEAAGNATADDLVTLYLAGNVTLDEGYSIYPSAGTYVVNQLCSYKEGTTTALHVARCRKL